MSVALFSLAGLPPSPLFVSEVMILLGGMQAGLLAVSSIAAVLLALGFLGLAHSLLEGLLDGGKGPHGRPSRSVKAIGLLAGIAAVALLGLTVIAYALPGSDIVEALMKSGA
jgi:hydrogenase-4 component F